MHILCGPREVAVRKAKGRFLLPRLLACPIAYTIHEEAVLIPYTGRLCSYRARGGCSYTIHGGGCAYTRHGDSGRLCNTVYREIAHGCAYTVHVWGCVIQCTGRLFHSCAYTVHEGGRAIQCPETLPHGCAYTVQCKRGRPCNTVHSETAPRLCLHYSAHEGGCAV